jgi:hypothetical protein
MKIKLMNTVKYDVKCVKLMVLPGKVQGLGTMIKRRLQRLQTTATIQPTGYASLMKVSSGNNCAILQVTLGLLLLPNTLWLPNSKVLYKMNSKTATGGMYAISEKEPHCTVEEL